MPNPNPAPDSPPLRAPSSALRAAPARRPPALFQIVVECRDEAEQRTLFERLMREGLKLRLLVL
jgi:hypothetical protein